MNDKKYSNSYPFLGISREHDVPYGAVLWHAQVLETRKLEPTQRFVNAMVSVERSFEANSSGEIKREDYTYALEAAVIRILQVKSGLRDAYTGEMKDEVHRTK